MSRRFLPLISLLATALPACTTVYVPPRDPLTEAALEEAIRTVRSNEERVQILEDGLQAEVYVYEWKYVPAPTGLHSSEILLSESLSPGSRRVRMLASRPRSVYLPYASIRAVEARSWPLWSGVELAVLGAGEGSRARLEGPLVIRAPDVAGAERLADAIDRIRRTRLPYALDAEVGGTPADPGSSASE